MDCLMPVYMFFKAFTKCAFSFTYILFLHILHWIIYVRFVTSADETKLPDPREKKPLVPRVGEQQKATTGTSLKMFLKRSVDCRMGCFLRSMSWMLGRAGFYIGNCRDSVTCISGGWFILF